MTASWAIVTGEYPPRPGGVADYTRLVATALAGTGDEVHVFFPASREPALMDEHVVAHPIESGFGTRGLRQLSAALARLPRSRHLLVQWVPHAFGWKAMNVPFALWAARQRDLWVMFHEVSFPRGTGLKGDVLSAATSFMAARLARSAHRIFVAIPAWTEILRPFGVATDPLWLPVPSNVPTELPAAEVEATRRRLPEGPLVGHFGTYGSNIAALLAPALRLLLREFSVVLLGRGAERFLAESDLPRDRIVATGALDAPVLAQHIAACDVMVQPYPDGASSRRGSLMAALALARPVVTTEGRLSESIWRESGAVRLSSLAAEDLAACTRELVHDEGARRELGARSRALYSDRFALEHTVRLLRAADR
ncbi:MAG TPA: glycosyltransferase family 4 protein [Planctomycetota bacterium]|nr:glycosyltransferase family 4 protein [Planctomycetota bacterium]